MYSLTFLLKERDIKMENLPIIGALHPVFVVPLPFVSLLCRGQ